jgi:diguanylate cyclase (GGDEF)-like protein/PAS domain S-box-containing protein
LVSDINLPAGDNEAAIRAAQVKSLYAGIPTSQAANVLISIILAGAQWRVVDSTAAISWLVLLAMVMAIRMGLFVAQRRASGTDDNFWLQSFRLSVATSGVTWGLASFLLFPANDIPHQAFLAFALAGMTAGAISSLAIDRVSVLAFTLPALGALIVHLFAENNEISMTMGVMVTLFLLFSGIIAQRTYRTLYENVSMRIADADRENSLRENEERLKEAQRVAHLGSFEWNIASGELQWSDEHFRLWGLAPQSVTPSYEIFRQAIHPDDVAELEKALQQALDGGRFYNFKHRVCLPDGSERYMHGRGEAVFDAAGTAIRFNGTIQDVSEQKQAEETIHNLAFFDTLTGLPNRYLLKDRLQHTLASCARNRRHGAILFIDLDHFKELNDTKGHGAGDQLLIEVTNRLQACVRIDDTICRLGGDEFVVVLNDLNAKDDLAAGQAELIAEKIRTAINQPFALQDQEYFNSPSIGISMFGGEQDSIDELLKRADTAMYQAKKSGRNAIRFFDSATHAAMEARIALESDLRGALPENQLMLFYQMQVDRAGDIFGAEVLLRWQHPDRGLVSPFHFIPLAEETGLIVSIGSWVLETACTQLKEWESDPDARHLQLAVNVSARQFYQPDFVEQVCAVIKKTAIDPRKLKLELTESLVLDNVDETINKMLMLKESGVRFSMDDFGTGYSSLAYLSRLPLDQVKIDQSFVRNIDVKSTDAVIVQTIIGMANNLNMEVIAEGVETVQQRDFLEDSGCFTYQGYLFGKPVPVGEFESTLAKKAG